MLGVGNPRAPFPMYETVDTCVIMSLSHTYTYMLKNLLSLLLKTRHLSE